MSDAEFETIQGESNIILVAPHGYMGKPKDDEQTARITRRMQKRLNCYAVINEVYRKPRKGEPDFDRENRICNLNKMFDYKETDQDLYDAFVGAIRRFKDEIENQGHVPYIFHIHGASTNIFDSACKKADAIRYKEINVLVGTGMGVSDKDKEESLTASPEDVNRLIACLEEEQLVAYSTNHREYAAKKAHNLNQLFREPNYPDDRVISFQLEIRKRGLRDTPTTAANTAIRLATAIGKFTGVNVYPDADIVEADEASPVSQEKVAAAVEHILAESSATYEHAINKMISIGNYLVENFFGGSYENAKKPRQIETDHSLRQIQEQLKVHLGRASKTWVYDALKVSIDYHALEGSEHFQTYGNLSNSHKVKLAYADETIKTELIELCSAESWSVRELGAEIAKRKPNKKKSTASTLLRVIRNPEKRPEELPKSKESFQEQLSGLKPKEQEKIRQEVKGQLEALEAKIQKLNGLKQQFTELLGE